VHLAAFLAVAAVVVLTPGVDMALVTRNALLHGRAAALASAAGVNAGIALWTVAAALGLATLVVASPDVFTAVRLAGAGYLLYLGGRALWASRCPPADVALPPDRPGLGASAAFRQGVISNALNPKIAVLFTSLLPQFAGAHASAAEFLLLGAIFNAMGIVWLVIYALLVARGRAVLLRPRVRVLLDRVSGVVLVALGLRLAMERRG
jgi:threonine/homoserine/homoserine lactone efflux protein